MIWYFTDPPSRTSGWLANTFPHRRELLDEISGQLRHCTPIDFTVADKSFFGHVVERGIGLDLAVHPPYAPLFDCLPTGTAHRLLKLSGHQPPADNPEAAWREWRRSDGPQQPARLFTAASCLTQLDTLLHPGRTDRSDGVRVAVARRLLLRDPELVHHDPRLTWQHRAAFQTLWASYTSGFDTALRSYGPATAQLRLLDGRRHADFLLGDTILELKTGRLDQPDRLNAALDQLLTYTLLAHYQGHRVTHTAIYAARYQRLLRYPAQQILDQLAGTPINPATTGARLADEIRADQPLRRAA